MKGKVVVVVVVVVVPKQLATGPGRYLQEISGFLQYWYSGPSLLTTIGFQTAAYVLVGLKA